MEFNFGSIFGIKVVYLLVLSPSGFKVILSLISNRSLDSFLFVTVNTLQTNVLICVMPSFPLLILLLFGINGCHKCIMCLGFVHYD